MRLRGGHLANFGLAAASVLVVLALAEGALRVVGYRSRRILESAEGSVDYRTFHMGTGVPRAQDPLTVFDAELLWRIRPEAGADVDEHGYRGGPIPLPPRDGEYLAMAFGDSNTIGPLNTTAHWPGFLQDLARLNRGPRRVRVVNAGVYGHTSLQGLQAFRSALRYRPDLAYFSFGANDADPVRTRDVVYARRLAFLGDWDWLRLASPLARAVWWARDRLRGDGHENRVPPAEYRRYIEQFVDLARRHQVVPVLLTRPFDRGRPESAAIQPYNDLTCRVARERAAACLDVQGLFGGRSELFADPSLLNRTGYRRLAEALTPQLAALGVLDTEMVEAYRSAVDLGRADDRALELGDGWLPAEEWRDDLAGRWSQREASLVLAHRHGESALVVDLSCETPSGHTAGRVEVGGRTLARLPATNGRHRLRLDLTRVTDERLGVRFVVESAYVPLETAPGSRDSRTLGVFVHSARLLRSPLAGSVLPGRLPDDTPELAAGWWSAERWVDGPSGRWTTAVARLAMGRVDEESALMIDATFRGRDGRTVGRIDVGDRTVSRFDRPDGRSLVVAPLPPGAGKTVRIVVAVDRPFVAKEWDARSVDARPLGAFIHAVHLLRRRVSPEALTSRIDFAALPDDAAPLLRGWGPVRADLRGRESDGNAEVLIAGSDRGGRLVVDVAAGSHGWAAGRLEVNGQLASDFSVERESVIVARIAPGSGRVLKVGVLTELIPPPPRGAVLAGGVVVRSMRFEPASVEPR